MKKILFLPTFISLNFMLLFSLSAMASDSAFDAAKWVGVGAGKVGRTAGGIVSENLGAFVGLKATAEATAKSENPEKIAKSIKK